MDETHEIKSLGDGKYSFWIGRQRYTLTTKLEAARFFRIVESARELVEQVLSEFQLEILSEEPVEYRCYCSRERVTRALISMGREELNSLIREQGRAELTCQFCDKVYHYTNEELEGLLASL